MHHWCYGSKFNDYVEAFGGNTFAAILYVSNIARHRAKSVHNCITESQAISWVITGVEPKMLRKNLEYRKIRKTLDLRYAEDRLIYIDDKLVREATRETILESRKQKHLIYKYKDIFDEPHKARVRILSNIIWDEMMKIRIDNMI